MLIDGRSQSAFSTTCTSPIRGDTLSMAPTSMRCCAFGVMARPGRGQFVFVAVLGAAHHADQAPYRVVVNRRARAGAPDEADDGEALARVAVQEVLGIAGRRRARTLRGQPVVVADQLGEQRRAFAHDAGLVAAMPLEQGVELGDERVQAVHAVTLPCRPSARAVSRAALTTRGASSRS